MQSTLALLGQVFYSNRPIDTATALVGRRDQLRRVLVELAAPSGVPVVVGPQAIGKSSLLAILIQALVGEGHALEQMQLENCAPSNIPRMVVYLRLKDTISNGEALSSALGDRISRAFVAGSRERRFELREFSVEATTPVFKLGAKWSASKPSEEARTSVSFAQQLRSFRKATGIQEVVIVLDECEQIPWLDRLLDWARDFEDEGCRFVLAVRETSGEQLADPERGDYRLPTRIRVPQLGREEGQQIFAHAAERLADIGIIWRLSEEAENYIYNHAAGEPWYYQMIGHSLISDPKANLEGHATPSLRLSYRLTSTLNDVMRAEKDVVDSHLRTLHLHALTSEIAGNEKREELLLCMARYPGSEIPLEFIKHVQKRRDPGAVATAKRMTRRRAGRQGILTYNEERSTFSFRDHQMKVFARLKAPSTPLVDEIASQHLESFQLLRS